MQLEFKLIYYDVAVQYVNHYAMGSPLCKNLSLHVNEPKLTLKIIGTKATNITSVSTYPIIQFNKMIFKVGISGKLGYWFNGISTLNSYLIPNPVYIYFTKP